MITFYNVIYRLAIKQKYERKEESLKTLIGYLSRNKVNGISFHINSVNNRENMVVIYFNIKYKGGAIPSIVSFPL